MIDPTASRRESCRTDIRQDGFTSINGTGRRNRQ